MYSKLGNVYDNIVNIYNNSMLMGLYWIKT